MINITMLNSVWNTSMVTHVTICHQVFENDGLRMILTEFEVCGVKSVGRVF